MQKFQNRTSRRNLLILMRFLIIMIVMIGIYSVIFHTLMEREGRDYSWVTSIYWTLTVMSTLGFGDITFHSDLGRIFSIVVLISGVTSLLVFMPFTFIEFFYEPWIRAQSDKRVPRNLRITGHVVLVGYGPITRELIEKLTQYNYKYVLLKSKLVDALRLHDQGLTVVLGDLDDPETYRNIQIEDAVMLVTTNSDFVNTSVVSTVRELTTKIPIISTVREPDTTEILKVAGSTYILELSEKVGQALARRARGKEATAHVIGKFDKVLIAEANAIDTPFVGKTIGDSKIRDVAGVTVVGMWERGQFKITRQDTLVDSKSVLVLTASSDQIARFNEMCRNPKLTTAPVIIIGGGRVGRVAAKGLDLRGIEYRIIEHQADRALNQKTYIVGNALKKEILERAGIKEAQTVIITTHDDDVNIYLAILCRRLREDIRIVSRVIKEKSVGILQRVGSDYVISDVAMGANSIFNLLKRSDILMVTEGIDVFKVEVPHALVGKTIAESFIRSETGCNIVAIESSSETLINPGSQMIMEKGMEIVLIGSEESETCFLQKYGTGESIQ
jgi:voltage-gated potassium channel